MARQAQRPMARVRNGGRWRDRRNGGRQGEETWGLAANFRGRGRRTWTALIYLGGKFSLGKLGPARKDKRGKGACYASRCSYWWGGLPGA